jgi:deoxycytidine triphosphate deaminase
MSLLSYNELRLLQDQGVVMGSKPEHVNATSIDVTLGVNILVERKRLGGLSGLVSLRGREPLNMRPIHLTEIDSQHTLSPGDFVLAQSEQIFNLPEDISCEYKLKSSMARIGLEHLTAGWCDAGWHGSVLTLELKNITQRHKIKLQRGDLIGQVVFFRHKPVPLSASYAQRGRYNHDLTVKGVKP